MNYYLTLQEIDSLLHSDEFNGVCRYRVEPLSPIWNFEVLIVNQDGYEVIIGEDKGLCLDLWKNAEPVTPPLTEANDLTQKSCDNCVNGEVTPDINYIWCNLRIKLFENKFWCCHFEPKPAGVEKKCSTCKHSRANGGNNDPCPCDSEWGQWEYADVNDKDKTVAIDNKMSTVEQAFEAWLNDYKKPTGFALDSYDKHLIRAGFNKALEKVREFINTAEWNGNINDYSKDLLAETVKQAEQWLNNNELKGVK